MGWGYGKISEAVDIPVWTVRAWVSDIPFDREIAYRMGVRDTFARKGPAKSQSAFRNQMISVRGWKCEECGLETWRGKPIPLELHHISGRKNTPENVVLLCANCHALTPNYRNRNNN